MLSVVLSNYNHSHYLPTALSAILAQTRPADEIIVIDDCSTDNSVEVIEGFLGRHPDIRLERNPTNLGTMATVNRGLNLAKHKFIFFAAADDAVYPDLFAAATALLSNHPQAAVFSSATEIIDGEGRSLGILSAPVPLSSPGYIPPDEVARRLMYDDSWFSGASAVWRRKYLLEIGGFPSEFGSCADSFVSRQLALQHGCCFDPAVLCRWRRIAGGMAWTAAVDEGRTRPVLDAIEQRMLQMPDVFPPGYAARWKNREIFGMRRFALSLARRNALRKGIVPRAAAALREAVQTLWLFLTLRPRDLFAVLHRRLFSR